MRTRPKLAFFTPLNPDRGGVTDHSEELLPELAGFADIDIVNEQALRPDNPAVTERFRIISPQEFLRRHGEYDLPIYQLGNNYRQHGYMVHCMREVPGIIALQDYCLQYLVLPVTLGAGDLNGLRELLQVDYPARAGRLARQLLFSAIDPNSLSFAGAMLRASRGVIVHSRYLEDVVRRDHPAVAVRNLAMGVTIPDLRPVADLRARYGYGPDDFVLATLSTLVPKKRLMLLLEVVRTLHDRYPSVRLLVVGGGALGADAREFIARHGMDPYVRVTGWVDRQVYADLTALSDLVVDVRETGAGETANSLLRALAAGKPGIVTAAGVFLELPDAVCIKVDADHAGPAGLLSAIDTLYADRARLADMSRSARTFALAHLTLAETAEGYRQFVGEVLDGTAPPAYTLRIGRGRGLSGWLVRVVYRVFRLRFLYRNYGLADTIRRIRRELSAGAG